MTWSTKHRVGASVVNGRLFFKLLDGSVISCECIKEPYASQIVAACHGELTQQQVRSLLDYEPDTGTFRWKVLMAPRAPIGAIAGNVHDKDGRVRISIAGRMYFAHRLAWFWMTGEWPPNDVDHINGDSADNRWDNLRLATRSENLRNRVSKPSNSGFRGVFKRSDGWFAKIQVNRKQIYLGLFKTVEEADAAYKAAVKKYHGEFGFVRNP